MTACLTGKIAYLSTWLGFTIGCAAIRCCPGAIFTLADGAASLGYRLFRGFRRRSLTNLRIALGQASNEAELETLARRSLRNFFRACVEIGVAVNASDADLKGRIPIVGRHHLDAVLERGKGALLLSAHLGNFFLVGSRIAIEGLPAYVLVNQPRDGRFAELMDRYRLQVRQSTIHARPRAQALRELTEVLRRNQVAVMIADEYRDTSGIEVPLFGRTVIARRGPISLALRTGAAVVPACLLRQNDDSLRLVIEPEIELARAERGAQAVRENTIRITQWLERTVRAHPDQWNWMNIRHWVDESKDQESKVNEKTV
jgi:KDO2-lipid IV(A) lauroyltransferase